MRKTLFPFGYIGKVAEQKSIGGARPVVQATAQVLASSSTPMLASRIYSPGAMKHYDDSDPRFIGKSNQVENIYLPANEASEPRSGIAQIFSWLTTGRMR